MAIMIKKLLREPLFHFLILGVAIFIAYSFLSRPVNNEPGKIVITAGELASMREGYIVTWQRPPTNDEMEGLIRERVREEVYYQEALALGLDKDDIIIRRRLQQKMEFIAHDIAKRNEPTYQQLSAFLGKHPDLFKMEARYSFRQIYLNASRRGSQLQQDISSLLSELNQSGSKSDIQKMGDASVLPAQMTDVTAKEISDQFGKEFSSRLLQLPSGHWVGPVNAIDGPHLVMLSERKDGGIPALGEIHDAVLREFDDANQKAANEKFYESLLKNYSVTIEKPALAKADNLGSQDNLMK